MSNLVDEIKLHNIAEVVSIYVRLLNAGSGRKKGCCPFHREKTPSFYIDEREGYFKCFGCGEGGDIITFVEKIKGCDFNQATDYLCELFGIDKSKFLPTTQEQQEIEKTKSFYQAMDIINDYFVRCLKNDTSAMNYVKNIRGLNNETLDEFKFGLAKNNIFELRNYCNENGVDNDLLLKCGVIKKDETGKEYLFFRDRIMIPIHNKDGKIIAFGGRIYRKEDENGEIKLAKYLNSSENSFFKKGSILFNLNRAKKYLDKRDENEKNSSFIVVEGYMDAIALWQNGFKTGIAPLGTSITEQHLRNIICYCQKPVFIFDSDNAGKKASIRACEMMFNIIRTGIVPKFLTLQGAKDIDEFLKKYTSEDLKKQVAEALEIDDFLFKTKCEKFFKKDVKTDKIISPNQVAELKKEIMYFINIIPDELLKEQYKRYFNNKIYETFFGRRSIFNKRYNFNETKKLVIISNKIEDIEKKIIAYLLKDKEYLEENEEFNESIFFMFSNNSKQLFIKLSGEVQEDIDAFFNKNCDKTLEKYSIKKNTSDIIDKLITQWHLLKIENNNTLSQEQKILEIKKIRDKFANILDKNEND